MAPKLQNKKHLKQVVRAVLPYEAKKKKKKITTKRCTQSLLGGKEASGF